MSRKTYACEPRYNAVEGDTELLEHKRRIHSYEQPSEDTTCHQPFPPNGIVKHETTHDNGKYVCPREGCKANRRSFFSKSTLKRHVGDHDQRPKPACPKCGKTYSRSDSLKRHINNPRGMCRREDPLGPMQPANGTSHPMPGPSTQSHSLPKRITAAGQDASRHRRRRPRGASRVNPIVPVSSRQEGPRFQPYPSWSTAIRVHDDHPTVVTAPSSPRKAFSRAAYPVEYPYSLPASAPHLAQARLYTAPPGGSSHGSVAYPPWSYDLLRPISGLGDAWEQTKMLEDIHVGHTVHSRAKLEPLQRFISPLLPGGHPNASSTSMYRQPAADWHHEPLLMALGGVSAVGVDDAVDPTVPKERFAERSTLASGFDETSPAGDAGEAEPGSVVMPANLAASSLEHELTENMSDSFPGFGDDDMFRIRILPGESYQPPEDLEALFSHIEESEFDLQFRECHPSAVELSAEDDEVDGSLGVDGDLNFL